MNGLVCHRLILRAYELAHADSSIDLYYPQNVEDLRKFFDYYLKEIKNDWPFTPKVRLSILNSGHEDIINRPEHEFPLARQVSERLFLNCHTLKLGSDCPPSQTNVKMDGATGQAVFTHEFSSRKEWVGYAALKVWIETIGTDDIDIYVKVSKLGPNDKLLETRCIDVGYLQDDPEAQWKKLEEMRQQKNKSVDVYFNEGPNGMLRASHRELDFQKSTEHHPMYTHKTEAKIKPGQVVPLIIELWPYGWIWEAGEKLQLTVSGYRTWPELLPHLESKSYNKGEVVIHAGGDYGSYLLMPIIP